MFRKEHVTRHVVEISDESKQALAALDGDVQALQMLMDDMLCSMRGILSQLSGEIVHIDTNGPEPLLDEPLEGVGLGERSKAGVSRSVLAEDERVRSSPFARRPRTEQVNWLLKLMEKNHWYNAAGLAQRYANDTRELRYLRHSIGGRLREMNEDGLATRRTTRVRGVLYEYTLTEQGLEAKGKL